MCAVFVPDPAQGERRGHGQPLPDKNAPTLSLIARAGAETPLVAGLLSGVQSH